LLAVVRDGQRVDAAVAVGTTPAGGPPRRSSPTNSPASRRRRPGRPRGRVERDRDHPPAAKIANELALIRSAVEEARDSRPAIGQRRPRASTRRRRTPRDATTFFRYLARPSEHRPIRESGLVFLSTVTPAKRALRRMTGQDSRFVVDQRRTRSKTRPTPDRATI